MKELLNEARLEIVNLRRSNEILLAQVGIVEVFAAALGLRKENQAMSPDVAWALQKEIDRLEQCGKVSEPKNPVAPKDVLSRG